MKQSTILLLFLLPYLLQACNPNATSSSLRPDSRNSVATTSPSTVPTSTTLRPVTNPKIESRTGMDCEGSMCERNVNNEPIETYQHIIVSGLPFQRGESHGLQAKDKILTLISHYKSSKSMPPWDDCIKFVQAHYLESLKFYYPNGLEEMRGIAQGANVTLEDIVILNARYDLTRWKRSESIGNVSSKTKATFASEIPECAQHYSNELENSTTESNGEAGEECTGAVALSSATKYAHVLLGQNWDTSEIILKNDTAILLEVHPDPCERIKPFVMLTEAGQLGRSGMNSEGLGIVAMSLWSSSDKFHREEGSQGFVPATLLRRMFLEAPNFSIGLRRLLTTPRHVSVNMIIATGDDEALNIELTPDEYFVTQVPLEKEIYAHSNHFKSSQFLAKDYVREGSRGSSSLFRDRRVEKHLMSAWPRINESTFQKAFRDHVGYPNSVCEHSVPKEESWRSALPGQTTVASIIFNLNQRTLQLCKGPPCTSSYKEYRFKFSQL
ncbi:Acyl-coenzyme A:6-aminopenicillanic-acid-acyltransferase 40 kDa form [Orchesella cincta]|uniref:Acyl-coenzyme A:6-aminopenicillanic-acid-acyltransferase 40 kDa form n=1 Tax=Orchesella cincta TaxID=48709 RepID=A0A1D2NKY8_ORCCI|nr:Acyl-coenzyme A:6-aminopenicillanic-acid-acyltransferase 40 kDa form [Orchesella cincta]